MFRKKSKKLAGKIEVGLDVKRCVECDRYARFCLVDDKPATFHRWVEDVRALLRIDVFVSPTEMEHIHQRFKDTGVVAPGCGTEVIRELFALVEYPDGSVAKVKPEQVRFLDRGEG